MIPLMENKMKWNRSKKRKYPSIEIEMSSASYSGPDDYEMTIPMYQVCSSKNNGNLSSPNHGVTEQSFTFHGGDSGIEYEPEGPVQKMSKATSPIVDLYEMRGPSTSRRHSAVYLHPDRARYNYFNAAASSSRDYNAVEDGELAGGESGAENDLLTVASSSNASSLASIPQCGAASAASGSGGRGCRHGGGGGGVVGSPSWGRRRSSTWTGREDSDSMEPEFASLQARGSVGMHSLSDSLHKLTFTQSLAFPELARKLANRRRQEQLRAAINSTSQDDFEACSKFIAVAGVFLLSIMVYGAVNKYTKA